MTNQKKSDRVTIRFTPEEYAVLQQRAPEGRVAPYVRSLALDVGVPPEHTVDCIDELDAIIARAKEILHRPGQTPAELDRLTQAIKRAKEIRVSEIERVRNLGNLVEGDAVRRGLQAIQEGIVELAGDNLASELTGYGVPPERVERLRANLLESVRRFALPGGNVPPDLPAA